MRYVVLLISLLLCAPTAFGQVKMYERVGGDVSESLLRMHVDGLYIPVQRPGESDTLWMWVEGVADGQEPSYEEAKAADIVVWCHPQENPDPRHVMPDAGEVTVVARGRIIWVMDSRSQFVPDRGIRNGHWWHDHNE